MSQFATIIISSQNPKLAFICQGSNSGYQISHLEIPFLSTLPLSTWSGYMSGVMLKFTEYLTDGSSASFYHHLTVNPNQMHPIFQADLFLPQKNQENYTAVGVYANNFEIELIAPGKTEEFILYIFRKEFSQVVQIQNSVF